MKELVYNSKIIFVCVPTPMFESGECNLSIINAVIQELSQYKCIENKCQVQNIKAEPYKKLSLENLL